MTGNKCDANGDIMQYQFINKDEQIRDGKTVSEDYKTDDNELFIQ